MHEIGMPARGTARLPEAGAALRIVDLQVGPHDRDARNARHLGNLRVDLDLAVMFAECPLLLRRDVLVAQEDDAALGDEQAQLILLLRRQGRELEAVQLAADVARQVGDGADAQEGGFGWIGAGAGIDVCSAEG
jgi:hypothetical protein